MRRRSAVIAVALVVAGLLALVAARSADDDAPASGEELLLVGGTREPDGVPVNLDATLYLPDTATRADPAPAVLLAHGYGGSKDTLEAPARDLTGRGYVVLAYTARGFGRSGGKIHLDSPDYEVKDAQRMLDLLAQRPEVRQDAPGDPRAGVAGDSYGGALSLLLAGVDPRVDALVPGITWHDLRQAMFPQFATAAGVPATPADVRPQGAAGVFKKQWTAVFLGSAAGAGAGAGSAVRPPQPAPSAGAQTRDQLALETLTGACGRVATDLCLGYIQAATSGRPTPALLDLLWRSSPGRVAARITAPTMIIQGQADSLFPLSEADANAAAIAGRGTPVDVVWRAGGHDGGPDENNRLWRLTGEFFDRTLRGDTSAPAQPAFSVTVPDAVISSQDTNPAPQLREADAFPGLRTAEGTSSPLRTSTMPLTGGEQLAIAPPGAVPAAFTSLPGIGGLSALANQAQGLGGGAGGAAGGGGALGALGLSVLPGQAAVFETAPLERATTIVGAPRVRLTVRSTAADATLFASLQDVSPGGAATLPQRLVSPVRLEGLLAAGREITVSLPAVVLDVPAGHRLRLVVSSTDQGYAMPADGRGYQIALAGDRTLTLPGAPLVTAADSGARVLWTVAGIMLAVVLAAVAAALVRGRARRRRAVADPELVAVPLAVRGLGKAYSNGFRAVTDLTLRVEPGQVLGLLGPNGAGKTTTLRMLMGLIHPSEGEIRVFGHRVTPGAPVLSRLGSFVEGPGFLPHLSGRDNLELYWQATGRPAADAHLEEALEVAGLGSDLRRTVRTYSQGMRQRLAIAQAMLGLPELLVLDEPTNGLDPPQIREMREVLHRYAATGRTVVLSSHLLAEVEQTCTDVAVMHHGKLLAQGPVSELVEAATVTQVDVDDPARAIRLARLVPGVSEVERTPSGLVLRADATARADLVRTLAGAGVRVERVAPQRGLEQTFLALVGER